MTKEFATVGQQVGRSAMAVIDMMTQRGAIKGEELSTIGRLRDQCMQLVQMAESALDEPETEGADPVKS